MATILLPANTVVKIANASATFRIENMGGSSINVKYSSTAPLIADNDWGTVYAGGIEVNLGLALDLYAWSPVPSKLSVFSSNPVA